MQTKSTKNTPINLLKETKETFKHIKKPGKENQKALATWAANCAEHVLPYFEKEFPRDNRPREAIKACRTWVRTGVFKMSVIRDASLSAHAAARTAKEDSPARFAARSAGQAVATAHVPAHAIAAAAYAIKAVGITKAEKERAWQLKHLPKELRKVI